MSLLTIRDVAQRLQISRTSAYRLIQNGTIPHIRATGNSRGAIRIRERDLKEYIDRGFDATSN